VAQRVDPVDRVERVDPVDRVERVDPVDRVGVLGRVLLLGVLGRERVLGAVGGLALVAARLAVALEGVFAPVARRTTQAVRVAAAAARPSSETEVSRILNFWTLPVTVMGNSSVTRT